MVTNVGYDEESKEMTVTFTNGKTCAYAGVPEEVALQLSVAPSVGSMLNEQIKGQYSFRYV
jgi:hypothetical protein